ncbi:MAG: class I SAM-dependent methyltransferase [Candidatus Electrothrix sp. LOE1_4_5]|nr:class I SAM-dependent methyltransferase [Candidatus Electrothrix gigas]
MSSLCPLCHQHALKDSPVISVDYISGHPFKLYQCIHCRSWTTDTANLGSPEQYYGPAYYNSAKGKFSRLFEKIFAWNHRRNAHKIYRTFHPEKVLEIGCGRAYLLKELKKKGIEVHCLESDEAAEWILLNKEIKISTLTEEKERQWPYEDNDFDLVIFWHVLEHLDDPVAALRETARILIPGQHLCVSVPNITSLQARMHISTWFHLDVPRHCFHFSRSGLVDLLEKQGFEITKIESGDSIQNLYGWLQSLANLFTPKCLNSMYCLLQGITHIKRTSIMSLGVQILTVPFWLPVGLLGFFLEKLCDQEGVITVYAKKSYTTNTEKQTLL